MGTCWGDISEGVRVEVPNTDCSLPTKVFWIAGIVKLAGEYILIAITKVVKIIMQKVAYSVVSSHLVNRMLTPLKGQSCITRLYFPPLSLLSCFTISSNWVGWFVFYC